MLNIVKAPNSINRGLSLIIYANPGVGKTTLASTLPPDETLIITTEAGIGPLMGKGHSLLDIKQTLENNQSKTVEEVLAEVYKYLRTEKHPFKYIVIDNLSELENLLLQDYTKRRKKNTPELKEWGDVSYRIKEWTVAFRDLEYQGINIIFNAWETQLDIQISNGETITKTVPMVAKRAAIQLCGLVDVVGHLEVFEKNGKRWIRLGPSNQYITKTQFPGLDIVGEEADLMVVINKIKSYSCKGDKDETKESKDKQAQDKQG